MQDERDAVRGFWGSRGFQLGFCFLLTLHPQRTASGDAIRSVALTQDSFTSKASLCFSEGGERTPPDSSFFNSKTPQERFAYIKGEVLGGPAGPAFVTVDSATASKAPTCSNTPQKAEYAKIHLNLDVVDWLPWQKHSTSSSQSPERSPEHSRCTSPLLRRGDTSPEGSFKISKTYRADQAARELRKEKLQSGFDRERLHKAFDLPEEIAGTHIHYTHTRFRRDCWQEQICRARLSECMFLLRLTIDVFSCPLSNARA